MRVYQKSQEDIAKLYRANQAVRKTLDELEAASKPGVSTWDLNELADRTMRKLGATSAFLDYNGYPAVLCTSINSVIVHGIPRRDEVLKDGDVLGIDFGCFVEGFCGDSARTIPVGTCLPAAQRLIDETKKSLDLGIAQAKEGNRIGDIGWAVQSYVEPLGFSVVRSFVGHGIGRAMHEDPQVPNYGSPGRGLRLKVGWVIAIEPMVNAGTPEVRVLEDRWTAVTADGSLSAHFEHSVAITENGPVVLSHR
ncbi:MAG: type I methionyl aminopeptidase [Polyangia bacterium]